MGFLYYLFTRMHRIDVHWKCIQNFSFVSIYCFHCQWTLVIYRGCRSRVSLDGTQRPVSLSLSLWIALANLISFSEAVSFSEACISDPRPNLTPLKNAKRLPTADSRQKNTHTQENCVLNYNSISQQALETISCDRPIENIFANEFAMIQPDYLHITCN